MDDASSRTWCRTARRVIGLALGASTACALSACGAAPAVVPERVALALAPEVGARYDAIVVVEARAPGVHGRSRSTSHGTLEVVAVDAETVTLRSRGDAPTLEMPDNVVRLPTLVGGEPWEIEMRIDRRGVLVAAPTVISGQPAIEPLSAWAGGFLPEAPVAIGETWPLGPAHPLLGQASVPAPRDGTVELVRVEGARADLRWTSTSRVGPIPRHDGPLGADVETRGEAALALGDGLTRAGESHTTFTWSGDEPPLFLPSAIALRWCVAREGEAPCEPEPAATDDRPAARVYEGEACTARLAALDTALAATPVDVIEHDGELPTASRGTEPLARSAPQIAIGEAITLDGRAVTTEQMLLDLDTMRRNWRILHPRQAFPERVRILARPATPLSAIAPVLEALGTSITIELVVDTGRRRALPALPEWARTMPEDPEEPEARWRHAWFAAIAGCPAMFTMLGAMANADVDVRLELLRRGSVEALATCRCGGADVDAIEPLVAHLLTRREIELGALVVPAGATGPIVRLPLTGTAADLAAALSARATTSGPVRLRFR